jgi:hypothetical protein
MNRGCTIIARPSKLGGGTFAVFSSISRSSSHGAWGLAGFYDSSPQDYPKYAAVLQWAARHGQPANLER